MSPPCTLSQTPPLSGLALIPCRLVTHVLKSPIIVPGTSFPHRPIPDLLFAFLTCGSWHHEIVQDHSLKRGVIKQGAWFASRNTRKVRTGKNERFFLSLTACLYIYKSSEVSRKTTHSFIFYVTLEAKWKKITRSWSIESICTSMWRVISISFIRRIPLVHYYRNRERAF